MAQNQTNKGTGWGWSIPAAAIAATFSSFSPYIGQPAMTQSVPQPSSPSASTPFDERLLDAKLEAVEARTETKFAQLLGKIDLLVQGVGDLKSEVSKLDGKIGEVDSHTRAGKREVITAIIATGLGVAALAWAGVQIFQSGLGLSQGAFQAGMAAGEVKK
ncbi:MAG: hypothetical protein AB7F98_10870 [Novosphingobium sp.]